MGSGFDIVIGNPPYVKYNQLKSDKNFRKYKEIYSVFFGQSDLYLLFYELSHRLLSKVGVCSLITPSQWLSIEIGTELRKLLVEKLIAITDYRDFVDFETATVDTNVFIFQYNNTEVDLVSTIYHDDINFSVNKVNRNVVKKNINNLGVFMSHFFNIELLEKLQKYVGNFEKQGFTCGVGHFINDFYELTPLLFNNENPDLDKEFKIINSGTLLRGGNLWGKKEMKYDGKKFLYPVVNKSEFIKKFPKLKNQIGPKIVIGPIDKYRLSIDIHSTGSYFGARPLLFVKSSREDSAEEIIDILFAYAILNSNVIVYYLKMMYENTVAGNFGFKITSQNIKDIPFPEVLSSQKSQLVKLVKEILDNPDGNIEKLENEIDQIVYQLYELTPEEIKIIENTTKK